MQDIVYGNGGGTWAFLHQITYGEMLIAILLVLILSVMLVRLVFDAFRWWW